MTIRNIKIIGIITIFLLSFITHQLYDWFPNNFLAVFFPVNESIWEHLKMIFSTTVIWMLIEQELIDNINQPNFFLSSLSGALSTIIVFLILFLPIYYVFEYNEIITIILYLIAIIGGQIVSYYILNLNKGYNLYNLISLILIPIILTLFGYLTFNPIKTSLFYDQYSDKYGIYNYYSNK